MMKCLEVTLSEKIDKDKQRFDDLIAIESLRDFILSACDDSPKMIKDAINNKTHSLASIIYSRPYKQTVRIFGIGEIGDLAINAIFVKLSTLGYMKIKHKKYKVKNLTIEVKSDYLAVNNGLKNIYTTLTPINIFNRHNYKVFKKIYHSAFGDNIAVRKDTILKATKEQEDNFFGKLKDYFLEQIKDFIAYYSSSLLGGDKEVYEFVNSLKIDWQDINIVFGKYHTEEMAMPMITGKFTSNFLLPKFIGYKIGKGFGELSFKSKGANLEL